MKRERHYKLRSKESSQHSGGKNKEKNGVAVMGRIKHHINIQKTMGVGGKDVSMGQIKTH